jgi:hypothetical protein
LENRIPGHRKICTAEKPFKPLAKQIDNFEQPSSGLPPKRNSGFYENSQGQGNYGPSTSVASQKRVSGAYENEQGQAKNSNLPNINGSPSLLQKKATIQNSNNDAQIRKVSGVSGGVGVGVGNKMGMNPSSRQENRGGQNNFESMPIKKSGGGRMPMVNSIFLNY